MESGFMQGCLLHSLPDYRLRLRLMKESSFDFCYTLQNHLSKILTLFFVWKNDF